MFSVGDMVTINNNISKTDRLYTVNSNMVEMKGKVYKISEILNSQRIRVNNWVWHPDDLTLYMPESKQNTTPVLYNIDNLDI